MRLHIRKRQEGQALVEFTIVATLLILLLLGIAQFGIVWNNYVSVTQAAREGARRAVVKGSEGQAAMVQHGTDGARTSAPSLNQALMGVSVTAPSGSWAQGEPIKVTVTYPYKVDLLGFAFKQGTLSSSTTMRRE
jgi:Flp pilus assembly protein TadG